MRHVLAASERDLAPVSQLQGVAQRTGISRPLQHVCADGSALAGSLPFPHFIGRTAGLKDPYLHHALRLKAPNRLWSGTGRPCQEAQPVMGNGCGGNCGDFGLVVGRRYLDNIQANEV